MSNFAGLGRGAQRRAAGAEGAHLLLSQAPGSGLGASRSCSCSGSSSERVLAAGSLGFPLTCPRDAADRRAGLGRLGWEEARPPPWAGESLRTRGHPGSALRRRPPSRAESSVPAGRRPPPSQAALCTLPSALCLRPSPCLPRSCSLTRPDAAPARPPGSLALPLRASARSRTRASAAGRCAPGSDLGSPLPGRGCRSRHLHSSVQAGTGSRALAARCYEATPQPQRRKREGDRERAGGGGRRKGGEMEKEGGTESSLLLPAARSIQASTAGNLGREGESGGGG